jgi:hypothetical protein
LRPLHHPARSVSRSPEQLARPLILPGPANACQILPGSHALKMEAVGSSETDIPVHQITRRRIENVHVLHDSCAVQNRVEGGRRVRPLTLWDLKALTREKDGTGRARKFSPALTLPRQPSPSPLPPTAPLLDVSLSGGASGLCYKGKEFGQGQIGIGKDACQKSVRTSKETRYVSATGPNRLMLFVVRASSRASVLLERVKVARCPTHPPHSFRGPQGHTWPYAESGGQAMASCKQGASFAS